MMLLAHVEGPDGALALWTHWVHEPASALSLAAVTALYIAGVRAVWARAGRGRGIHRRQAACFAAGVVVLVVALMSPIDALADDLFSAHMLQHVLLAVAAPPLLVAGEPVLAALWTVSPERRRSIVRWLRERRVIVVAWRIATAPQLAWAIHAAVLWLWHVPVLYRSALDVPALHALEHVSFVGSASLMWWGILHPTSRRSRRVSYGIGVLALFATMLQSGALGALITLSHRLWYPFQSGAAAAWGITPLDDQQVAGLIMWVGGGLLQLVLVNVLVFMWMRENEQYGRVARAAGRYAPQVERVQHGHSRVVQRAALHDDAPGPLAVGRVAAGAVQPACLDPDDDEHIYGGAMSRSRILRHPAHRRRGARRGLLSTLPIGRPSVHGWRMAGLCH